jgi:hypothetical protein
MRLRCVYFIGPRGSAFRRVDSVLDYIGIRDGKVGASGVSSVYMHAALVVEFPKGGVVADVGRVRKRRSECDVSDGDDYDRGSDDDSNSNDDNSDSDRSYETSEGGGSTVITASSLSKITTTPNPEADKGSRPCSRITLYIKTAALP